ncbi:MAG: cytochrome c1 [Stenotrophomonas sp.]|nr:cytochrome c1 [Stenotrophomonas sp.]
MTERWMVRMALAATMLLASGLAVAAEGTAKMLQAGNDLGDRASLQRGAQLYMNYCSSCHALKYLRYSRMAADLGLTEEEVMNNLNFTGSAIGDPVPVSMPKAEAEKWFGKMPPDLSLISRVRGPDWVYTYLKSFYLDSSRPLGWNNTVFPNASMPNPLWQMQGLQHAVHGKPEAPGLDPPVLALELRVPGNVDPGQYDQAVRDITNFLAYAGEPAALKRQQLGVWVVLFLAFLTFLLYLLKKDYWKDVH